MWLHSLGTTRAKPYLLYCGPAFGELLLVVKAELHAEILRRKKLDMPPPWVAKKLQKKLAEVCPEQVQKELEAFEKLKIEHKKLLEEKKLKQTNRGQSGSKEWQQKLAAAQAGWQKKLADCPEQVQKELEAFAELKIEHKKLKQTIHSPNWQKKLAAICPEQVQKELQAFAELKVEHMDLKNLMRASAEPQQKVFGAPPPRNLQTATNEKMGTLIFEVHQLTEQLKQQRADQEKAEQAAKLQATGLATQVEQLKATAQHWHDEFHKEYAEYEKLETKVAALKAAVAAGEGRARKVRKE